MTGIPRTGRAAAWLALLVPALVAAAPGRVQQVASVDAPGTGGRYELSVGPCAATQCTARIAWRDSEGRVQGTARLPWSVPGPVKRVPSQPGTWEAGEEEQHVSIRLTPIAIDADTRGMLVEQHGGFEHVSSNHAIYGVVGGHLRRLWAHDALHGPVGTYQEMFTPTSGPPHHLVFHVSPEDADTLEVHQLRWNRQHDALRPIPAQRLRFVVAASHPDATQARAARQAVEPCLQSYMVLATPKGGEVMLALPSLALTSTQAELRRVKRCAPELAPKIVALDQPKTAR